MFPSPLDGLAALWWRGMEAWLDRGAPFSPAFSPSALLRYWQNAFPVGSCRAVSIRGLSDRVPVQLVLEADGCSLWDAASEWAGPCDLLSSPGELFPPCIGLHGHRIQMETKKVQNRAPNIHQHVGNLQHKSHMQFPRVFKEWLRSALAAAPWAPLNRKALTNVDENNSRMQKKSLGWLV